MLLVHYSFIKRQGAEAEGTWIEAEGRVEFGVRRRNKLNQVVQGERLMKRDYRKATR